MFIYSWYNALKLYKLNRVIIGLKFKHTKDILIYIYIIKIIYFVFVNSNNKIKLSNTQKKQLRLKLCKWKPEAEHRKYTAD